MRFIVQVRIEPDTDSQSDVIDIAVIERDVLSPATLGLTIEEAKGLLAGVQNVVATEHCADALSNVEHCGECGRRFAHKDTRHLQVRSLYGAVTMPNPRWWTCICCNEKRRRSRHWRSFFRSVSRRSLDWSEPNWLLTWLFQPPGNSLVSCCRSAGSCTGTKLAGMCIA